MPAITLASGYVEFSCRCGERVRVGPPYHTITVNDVEERGGGVNVEPGFWHECGVYGRIRYTAKRGTEVLVEGRLRAPMPKGFLRAHPVPEEPLQPHDDRDDDGRHDDGRRAVEFRVGA